MAIAAEPLHHLGTTRTRDWPSHLHVLSGPSPPNLPGSGKCRSPRAPMQSHLQWRLLWSQHSPMLSMPQRSRERPVRLLRKLVRLVATFAKPSDWLAHTERTYVRFPHRRSLRQRIVTHRRYTHSLHAANVAAMKKQKRADIRERFGFAVKTRREELELTQEDLADKYSSHLSERHRTRQPKS